jgi:hypothetical protein
VTVQTDRTGSSWLPVGWAGPEVGPAKEARPPSHALICAVEATERPSESQMVAALCCAAVRASHGAPAPVTLSFKMTRIASAA